MLVSKLLLCFLLGPVNLTCYINGCSVTPVFAWRCIEGLEACCQHLHDMYDNIFT